MLSVDERERADRFLVPAPRERFVVARGTLREVLGRTIGRAPEQLRFAYPCVCGKPDCVPSRRKPRLELEPGLPPLRFNLSHTEGLAMLAVSIGQEVGIDVERIDHDTAIRPIVERAFGTSDAAALRALPEAEQSEAFYRGWTRKEAYGKARGYGFALPPDELAEAERWWFRDLPAPSGYVAALAVEGRDCAVLTDTWRTAAEAPR